MNRGLNPVTIRGWREEHDFRERAFTLGRLGINTGAGVIAEGQHRFNPKKGHQGIEWTMQFVIWDEPSEPLAFMVAQESDFVGEMKLFLKGKAYSFVIAGNVRLRTGEKCLLEIARVNDKDCRAKMTLFDVDPKREVICYFDLERFKGGLELLFPNRELE
jgi:hypothetical protein